MDYDYYDFVNVSISGNFADNGAGIFIDSPNVKTPTFGPFCTLANNSASMFGGAIFFGNYYQPSVLFTNAYFENK